ncbi:double C2-like domain-containing protein alpha [Mobula birostris]|uniref:double C2-like domain-containing protein alpha n=1 Tax=Mobula birostris TaxID=1983395 RepID=UPI003B27D447
MAGREKSAPSIHEHMAIDVNPGPIRPIPHISHRFPRPLAARGPGAGSAGPAEGPRPGLAVAAAAEAEAGAGPQPHLESPELDANDSDDSMSLGTLEFDLLYRSEEQVLQCSIHRAKGLKPMDLNGLSDPYVKLHLLPGPCKGNKLRTKTVRNSLNPCWNETLVYYGVMDEDLLRKTLRVSVCDADLLGHNDFIGETRVPLRKLTADQRRHFNIVLERPPPQSPISPPLRGIAFYMQEPDGPQEGELGRILLGLWFCSSSHQLTLSILRCAHLAAMDPHGLSDPYVKAYLRPDGGKSSKHKTGVRKRTLNPEFNEDFLFTLDPTALHSCSLQVTVWDHHLGRPNHLIGGVTLGTESRGQPGRHWLECLQKAGQRIERWHKLTNHLSN